MTAIAVTPETQAWTANASLPPVPEPGQVVEVRGSTWAVANVREQGLPRSPADESRAGIHHVVTLTTYALSASSVAGVISRPCIASVRVAGWKADGPPGAVGARAAHRRRRKGPMPGIWPGCCMTGARRTI